MHGLDTIINRNKAAAVRELAHDIDDNPELTALSQLSPKGRAIVAAIGADSNEENIILGRARKEAK